MQEKNSFGKFFSVFAWVWNITYTFHISLKHIDGYPMLLATLHLHTHARTHKNEKEFWFRRVCLTDSGKLNLLLVVRFLAWTNFCYYSCCLKIWHSLCKQSKITKKNNHLVALIKIRETQCSCLWGGCNATVLTVKLVSLYYLPKGKSTTIYSWSKKEFFCNWI
jgi:hypothetical protein